MISLCTVSLDRVDKFVDILINSVLRNSKFISEIIIAKPDASQDFVEEYTKNNTKITKFCSNHGIRYNQSMEHAINLHYCLELSKNKYIYFCDPDVFFYSAADEFFLNLMEKYSLNYVGVSHNSAVNHAFQFFPYVYSSLVRKDDLPPEDFLKGKLKFFGKFRAPVTEEELNTTESQDGYWLIPGPIPEYIEEFPKTDGLYDTGCNLWLWALKQNWKWLSFQTADCHVYDTKYFRGNVKIKDRFPKTKLIYHSVGGTNDRENEFQVFESEYNNFLNFSLST